MTGKKANIVLLFLSLLSGLVVSEVVLRIFVPQETKRLAIFDEDLGWRGTPCGQGVYIRSRDGISVPFKYNNAGFRDEDFPDGNDNLLRVLLLGDSFVESLEVEYEQTFHKLLEQHLNASDELSPASVVNISSQGYSTAQEILAYRKYRDELNPEIVLLAFYTGNDFGDNMREAFARIDQNGSLVFPRQENSELTVAWLRFQRWLYENSHLVFFIKNSAENLLQTKLGPSTKKEVRSSKNDEREVTSRLIQQLDEEVRGEATRLGVVVLPSKKELMAGTEEASRFVEEVCLGAGIPCLRLDTVLTREHFFLYDEHLNGEGHRVSAEMIFRFLESSLVDKNEATIVG